MTRKLNVLAQILACAGQMLIPSIPCDAEVKQFLHAFVGFAQAAIGVIAHAYSPDGGKL